MADVGLVIKEEYVVVPSQQQGSAFQNSCTCSLPKSVEAPEKNHARDHPGRQIFFLQALVSRLQFGHLI